MGNDYLGMGPQAGLYAACLPLPKHNITLSIATADPLAVGRKSHLACVTRDRVSGEPLISCLPEVVRAVHQNLVIKRLRSKVFFYGCGMMGTDQRNGETLEFIPYALLGWSVTAGIECMYGSAMYLITTGMSKSHARMVLSSEVVTNRRFSSTNVIVFTGPKC